MRIRLRDPKDGEVEPPTSGGLLGWLRSFRTGRQMAAPAPAPIPTDKRWVLRGSSRYFHSGRLCLCRNREWSTEYLFDVLFREKVQQIRIVVPEPSVTLWETRTQRRMPESARLQLVHQTLEALLDQNQLPAAVTVSSDQINAVEA